MKKFLNGILYGLAATGLVWIVLTIYFLLVYND